MYQDISGVTPKRYSTLVDLYEECDELSFLQGEYESITYATTETNIYQVKAMEIKLDAI